MRRLLLLPALAAAALVAACPSFDTDGVYACSSDADCRTELGERCLDGACAVPEEPCGNGRCDPDECTACPADCVFADCSAGGCNGDGSCDPAETCFTCPQDCVEAACGRCGDEGTCEPTECELDCGECSGHPICVADPCGPDRPASETDCTDALDEDCDGSTDCGDSDCFGPACAEDCSSPGDEDGDQLEECQDPDCVPCAGVEDCWNEGDEDEDGLRDCADDDCLGTEACPDVCGDSLCVPALECAACADCAGNEACGQLIEDCSNTVDDDGDELEDCRDPDCAGTCGSETSCGTGADNDGDGWSGCEDIDCWADAECQSQPQEDCTNGHDDNGGTAGGDINSDCQDTECLQISGCELSCAGKPVRTVLPASGGVLLRLPAMDRGENLPIDCNGTLAASAIVLEWEAPEERSYRFHTGGSSARSILVVADSQTCPTPMGCNVSPDAGTVSDVTVPLTAGQRVLILLAPLDPTGLSQLWLSVE